MTLTSTDRALLFLYQKGEWMALHEFPYCGTSPAALATRLRVAHRNGMVLQRQRIGKKFIEYVPSPLGVDYVINNLKEPITI